MTPFITGIRQGDRLYYSCPECHHESAMQIFRTYRELKFSVLCECGASYLVIEDVGNPVAPTMMRRENRFDLRDER